MSGTVLFLIGGTIGTCMMAVSTYRHQRKLALPVEQMAGEVQRIIRAWCITQFIVLTVACVGHFV